MKGRLCFTAAFVCSILWSHSAIAVGAESESAEAKVLPKPISQPVAPLPPSLQHTGADGTVLVEFTVDEEGHVKDPEIATSSSRLLNPYALKAVQNWRFSPGLRNGKPASFRLRAPVDFNEKPAEAMAASTSPMLPQTQPTLPQTPAAQTPAAPALVITMPTTTPAGVSLDKAPAAKRKATPVYPYDLLISGRSGWAEASFVVDYTGRPLFANPSGSSDRAFAKAVVAMVEASAFTPGKKGKASVMSPSLERVEFAGENALDPDAKRVLATLRKDKSAIPSATDLDERPKVVQQVAPAYPRALKDDGLTGQAEIEFVIGKDGRVLFPRIVSASHEDFGWAAATAVAQWKFQPPQKNGHPVEVRMSVPVLFTAQRLAEAD